VDMHATDLVAINGITRVLSVYSCQQGVYPRGHVLYYILKLGHDSFLPRPFQFIIHPSPFTGRYVAKVAVKAPLNKLQTNK
jgi:hypothetical protein